MSYGNFNIINNHGINVYFVRFWKRRNKKIGVVLNVKIYNILIINKIQQNEWCRNGAEMVQKWCGFLMVRMFFEILGIG
jgi:hypothetical protein